MKILFVDQTGQLGGGELSLLDVIRYSKDEREVALFTDGPFREALEKIGVRVHLLSLGKAGEVSRDAGSASILSSIPSALALRKELRRLAADCDIVYANSQKAFLMSALSLRKNQKLIWHLRDMLTADHFSPIIRKIVVAIGNRSASVVIANSKATLESFVEAGGKRSKAVVVYNGIDAAPFDAISSDEVLHLRRQFGVEGKFLIGIFGRLSPWKGQHIGIEAIAAVPGAHLVIVGDALFGEQEYAEGLRKQAQELGVQDRVHFLGFQRNIPALMKMMDVIAHTSVAPEPFGRVVVEAMLARKPAIAAKAGGVLEIVEDGQTGLLVSPGSTQELSQAILYLKQDQNIALKLGESGRLRASQFFTTDAMMLGIQKVFRFLGIATS